MASDGRRAGDCERNGCSKHDSLVYYCVDCDTWLCKSCWPLYQPHTNNKKGRDGLEHEKTQHQTFTKLKQILEPGYDDIELEELLCEDLSTTWFGVRRDSNGHPLFVDYDTFSAVTSGASSTLDRTARYPQVTSFVGQTNAGKSTLIKMLIRRGDEKQLKASSSYPTPVAGSKLHTHTPTSADVHLYADPELHHGRTPLLYADCEGFEGGEKPPLGAFEHRVSVTSGDIRCNRLSPGRVRSLNWANGEENISRSYVVKHLYPRILYTFSDVVVFVLRDSKTFEATALRLLLDWGKKSLETSVNQPTLPHAIIALNNTDIGVSQDEWDVSKATESLLHANKDCLDALNGQRDFIKMAKDWREEGRKVDSVLDLIHCYYSTFTVVRIPTKGRYQLLEGQIWTLHDVIAKACDSSFDAKRRARMLLNANELDVYLQSAYTHFSLPNGLADPFNFMKVSLKHNPIPTDFKGHILQLALSIRSQSPNMRSEKIFHLVGPLVASCIMLDCTRHRKGRPQNMFIEYADSCKEALEEFCDLYTTCEYRRGEEACVNVASAHLPKGHQNAKGKWIGDGRFKSKIRPERFWPIWENKIGTALAECDNELQSVSSGHAETATVEQILNDLHRKRITRLYDALGSARKFVSHATCLCCLMQAPLHALPCGHTLCTPCVRSYGTALEGSSKSRDILDMEFCPLHPNSDHWPSPYYVRFKPDHAGVRLLSLDGGGMRGIVELEVLQAIQKELGDQIPIQAFFDLIMGTSTGGIIALGFGVKGWSISYCTETFLNMCNQAFSKRKLQGISFLKHFVTLRHASKYETTPLREVLRDSFGDQLLFGSSGKASHAPVPKVAVTATDGSGKRAIVIANYNRRDDARKQQRKLHYDFPRPNDPDLELKIWEAAAATSAAPSIFKPFIHKPTERTYLDGALYHNNPVRLVRSEAQLLWPDMADEHPDILLSIGTGQDRHVMNPYPLREYETSQRSHRRQASDATSSTKRSGFTFVGFKQILSAMHSRFDNILHAENAWLDFCDIATTDENGSRYVRINPEIGSPPSLDDVSQLKAVQAAARNSLETTESRAQIRRVSHMLVASSFYYERTSMPAKVNNAYLCAGTYNAFQLRAFGDYLRNQQTKDFQLAFEIENIAEPRFTETVSLSTFVISQMRQIASFSLATPDIRVRDISDKIKISLLLPGRFSSPEKHVISGFPRAIMNESRVLDPVYELSAQKNGSTNKTRRSSRSTPHIQELRGCSRPRASKRNVSDPEVRSKPSELAGSEESAHSELSSRSTPFAHTTDDLRSSRPRITASKISDVAKRDNQGFSKRVEIDPVQASEPIELPAVSRLSCNAPVAQTHTTEARQKPEVPKEASSSVANTSGTSPARLRRTSGTPILDATHRQAHEETKIKSPVVYSSTFEELTAARKNTKHSDPVTTESPFPRDDHRPQILKDNLLRANTAPKPPPKLDTSSRYVSTAKSSELGHRSPPLSHAAKQRLPQGVSNFSRPPQRSLDRRLQYMSSASTLGSVASDVSEESVAESIDEEAFERRAAERAQRERLKSMASDSSLALSDMG
ncbi:hypothetical protein OPT61_g4511 [Boeremia exigua]|uniref:Uncharacterized protein n=1 Tax=Boeremia exigua TaxID=749465 RepID=A0ACC2IDX5_9PLEO|nr:hypothetical protein OPT61_g4511 [Boeremia exigua]